MTDHNSSIANNSKNESNNRTANTVGRDARKSGDAFKSSEATAWSTTAETQLTLEMTGAAGTIGTSWMSTSEGPPESDSRKVSKITVEKTAIFSRDTSNSSKNSQIEQ